MSGNSICATRQMSMLNNYIFICKNIVLLYALQVVTWLSIVPISLVPMMGRDQSRLVLVAWRRVVGTI